MSRATNAVVAIVQYDAQGSAMCALSVFLAAMSALGMQYEGLEELEQVMGRRNDENTVAATVDRNRAAIDALDACATGKLRHERQLLLAAVALEATPQRGCHGTLGRVAQELGANRTCRPLRTAADRKAIVGQALEPANEFLRVGGDVLARHCCTPGLSLQKRHALRAQRRCELRGAQCTPLRRQQDGDGVCAPTRRVLSRGRRSDLFTWLIHPLTRLYNPMRVLYPAVWQGSRYSALLNSSSNPAPEEALSSPGSCPTLPLPRCSGCGCLHLEAE